MCLIAHHLIVNKPEHTTRDRTGDTKAAARSSSSQQQLHQNKQAKNSTHPNKHAIECTYIFAFVGAGCVGVCLCVSSGRG